MKKKLISILLIFVMITLLVLIFSYDKKSYSYSEMNNNHSNISVMVYDATEEDYVQQSTIPIGNYELNAELSKCENNGEIQSYDNTIGKVYALVNGTDKCYFYFDILSSNYQLLSSIIVSGTSGTDASGNEWKIVGSTSETGVRYVGKNPNNYVWFNDERWRIIGLFNEEYKDYNGNIVSGNLVKIIRADSIGAMPWDPKLDGVGASTSAYGSNDWSESQAMMLLNPTTYLNSGYTTSGTVTHSNQINGEYVKSGNINIYRNMGAYFDYSDNPIDAYKPYSTKTSGFTSTTKLTLKRLSLTAQNLITEVKWLLYGAKDYTSAAEGSPIAFYQKERNINGKGYLYDSNRPAYWWGKVGLIYPSDYGYATGGKTINGTGTYDRNSCLNYQMSGWNSGSYNTYCAGNDWLLYTGATSDTSIGTATYQWTITPHSTNAYNVFDIDSAGHIRTNGGLSGSPSIRQVVYLKPNVKVENTTSGTYNDPYLITDSMIPLVNITKTGNTTINYSNNTWNILVNAYLCDKNGANCTSTSSIPNGSYKLNNTSNCSNSRIYSYTPSTGNVKLILSGNDTCNLYFDAVEKTINITNTGITNANTSENPWNIDVTVQLCNLNGTNCSSSSTIPSSNYVLNNNSSCTSGVIDSYSSGNVNIRVSGPDSCLIKLNKEYKTLSSSNAQYIFDNEITGFNTNIKQNLYRFTGAYQSNDTGYAGKVDNYICLGSTASTCPADNMFRIIGVVAANDSTTGLESGMIKVIKNNSIGQYSWDGGTSTSDTNRNVNSSNYRSTWTCTTTNNSASSGCFPQWKDSYLNTVILNTTYLNSISSFSNKIANVKWHCYLDYLIPTDTKEYSSDLCSSTASKISLIYVGDYLNAYNNGTNSSSSEYLPWLQINNGCSNTGSTYDTVYNCGLWTIANYGFNYTSSSYYYWDVYGVGSSGIMGFSPYFYINNNNKASIRRPIRPVFYLNSDVSISSGAGTYANPFRVNI